MSHRYVQEFTNVRELDNGIEFSTNGATRESMKCSVKKNVLARSQVRVKAGPELQKRCDPAIYDDPPCIRLDRPGDQLQRGALAGPVGTHHADRFAPLHTQSDILERPEVIRREQLLGTTRPKHSEHSILQRNRTGPMEEEALRDVLELDRAHNSSPRRPAQRSKTIAPSRNT